jgi:hypothetical protein
MGDLHYLPLRGRDLPPVETVELSGPGMTAALRRRARVYKVSGYWSWEHDCPGRSRPVLGHAHGTVQSAFRFAADHARRCP